MTEKTANRLLGSDAYEEFACALSTAKKALTFVGKFRTPPTPDVYEVWYRYVEGSSVAVKDQLSFSINVAKSVTKLRLQQLHEQFLSKSPSTDPISEKLSRELSSLQSLLQSQLSAGEEFNDSIQSASSSLKAEFATPAQVASSIATLLESNDRMQSQIKGMERRIKASASEVDRLQKDILVSQKGLLTDPLTGMGNRRFFEATLSKAIEHREQHGDVETYLLLADLDNFKSINDTFGHSNGDSVLRFVAVEMQKLARDAAIARYGGDEFALIAHADSLDHIRDMAEGICQFFADHEFNLDPTGEIAGRLTVSIGAARLREGDDCLSWFERADKLLYSAKHSGRNRTMLERAF